MWVYVRRWHFHDELPWGCLYRKLVPTASVQPDVWVEDAGHFLQEDAGEEIAERTVDFVDRTR